MAKLDYRYQGLDKKGNVKKSGNRLLDVEGMGIWVIIDYKEKRYAYQPIYPPTRQNWRKLTSQAKNDLSNQFRQ